MPVVIIPWNGQGCPHRQAAFEWVHRHYEQNYSWPIVIGTCDGEWSKGTAVRNALELTDATELVIADADSFVPPDDLNAAVDALTGRAWGMPHRVVRRLSESATADLLAEHPWDRNSLFRPKYQGVPAGGILVIRRSAYEESGGFDPGFIAWGGEDITMNLVLSRLYGVGHKGRADLIHLYHPPAVGYPHVTNKALAKRWRLACRDLAQLHAFIEERRSAWTQAA